MPPNSAEYQRAYRARKKAGLDAPKAPSDAPDRRDLRILELEEEVRHLKRQLSSQSMVPSTKIERRILPTVPFTLEYRPVPKVSPSRSPTSGRGRVG